VNIESDSRIGDGLDKRPLNSLVCELTEAYQEICALLVYQGEGTWTRKEPWPCLQTTSTMIKFESRGSSPQIPFWCIQEQISSFSKGLSEKVSKEIGFHNIDGPTLMEPNIMIV
jgi:hypothetical protein